MVALCGKGMVRCVWEGGLVWMVVCGKGCNADGEVVGSLSHYSSISSSLSHPPSLLPTSSTLFPSLFSLPPGAISPPPEQREGEERDERGWCVCGKGVSVVCVERR